MQRPKKPSCNDCIKALREISPRHYSDAMSDARTHEAMKARRPLYAACRALGHSLTSIGKAMDRDHSSVRQGIQRYQQIQLDKAVSAEFEAVLFRAIIMKAADIAARRRVGSECDNVIPMAPRQIRGVA